MDKNADSLTDSERKYSLRKGLICGYKLKE